MSETQPIKATIGDEALAGFATGMRAAYGDGNYERLVDVKTKVDPENFFRLNQNIQPKTV